MREEMNDPNPTAKLAGDPGVVSSEQCSVRTREEVETKIREIEDNFSHVLTGSVATVFINAPRALEQVAAESKLATLHWALGRKYKSKLKGVDC